MAGVVSANLRLIAVVLSSSFLQVKSCLPKEVQILAVSKGHPSSSIRELASLGQCEFGESRLQEALPKLQDLKDLTDIRWHFVGRLQSNKVRGVVRAFDVIHSVDSITLARKRFSLESLWVGR